MEKIINWKVPRFLTGNCFVYGRPGSGKSCKLLTVVQGLHSNGFKVWDLFGGKSFEGAFWCFPSDDAKLWRQIEYETHEFKNEGPKQYKVKLLYPMFKSHLAKQKKLPDFPPYVESRIFTIPFRDLPDDFEQLIATVIGPLGSKSSRLWNHVIDNTDQYSSAADLKHLFSKKFHNGRKDKLYDSFIKPLGKEGLLSSEIDSLNLDFIAEAEDKETVCVLCLEFVPDRYRYLILGYFLKKIFSLVTRNKIHKQNFAMFREASLFMKIVDADKSSEDTTSIFRNILTDIARYCRRGLFLGMDTQDASECRGMIEGSDDLLLLCEMPSQKSREVTCEPLKRDRRMTDQQIAYIGWKIKISEVCVVERGAKARILKRILPPRCRYWKSEYGDFYSLWKKERNRYIEVKEIIANYESKFNDRLSLLMARDASNEINDKDNKKISAVSKKKEIILDGEIKIQKVEEEVKPQYGIQRANFD